MSEPAADRDADVRARRARVGASAALVATIVAPALIVFAWSRPEPAAPREMPPLVLEPLAVRSVVEDDEAAAPRAPRGEQADARRRLYREANLAERAANDPPGRGEARQRELASALRAIAEEHGEAAIEAVRAGDLARLEPALRGELSETERHAELGGFVTMMERYGLVRGGRQVAPRFVVRTLFAARWNALHGRELTEGFSNVERRAYWGWLALRSESAPVDRRLEALGHYAGAGGARANEARAVLLYDAGRLDEASEAFEAAWQEAPSFRLRNHALACTEDAEGSAQDDEP